LNKIKFTADLTNFMMNGQFIVTQLVKKLPAFMKQEGLLPCSQRLATGPLLTQLNPLHSLTLYFLKVLFNSVFPFTPKSQK